MSMCKSVPTCSPAPAVRRQDRALRHECPVVVVGSVIDVPDVHESDKLCVAHIDPEGKQVQVLAVRRTSGRAKGSVALPGARVTTLDVPVSVLKMMGQESQGMFVLRPELGVAEDHSGILVLPSYTQVGADVAELLGLDTTCWVRDLSNRPDPIRFSVRSRVFSGVPTHCACRPSTY